MTDGQTGAGQIPPGASEWAEVTDPAWNVKFDRREAGLSLIFSGQCPRCLHQTNFTVPRVRPDAAGGRQRPGPEVLTMYCECGYPHEGHPDRDNSCGAYWSYEAEL